MNTGISIRRFATALLVLSLFDIVQQTGLVSARITRAGVAFADDEPRRRERERGEREERDRGNREREERDRGNREREERERGDRERGEREAARERERAEREAQQNQERENRERERAARERENQEREAGRERERQERAQREAQERAERENQQRERAERENRERERAERERANQEREAARERERQERAQREAQERTERENQQRERAERENHETRERERQEREAAREKERQERERGERERGEREAAREREKAEREARERAEHEAREQERVQRERERAEREAREREEREHRDPREREAREARERERAERAAREARELTEKVAREAKERAERELRERAEREARERAERERSEGERRDRAQRLVVLKAERDQISGQISGLKSEAASLERSIEVAHRGHDHEHPKHERLLREFDHLKAQLDQILHRKMDLVSKVRRIHESTHQLQSELASEENTLNRLFAEYDSCSRALSYAEQEMDAAYAEYQRLLAKEEEMATKAQILSYASRVGKSDGARESEEIGSALGSTDGTQAGRNAGLASGEAYAKSKSHILGQRAGWAEPDKAFYDAGFPLGKDLASKKAKEEVYALAYNEALKETMSKAPTERKQLDITQTFPVEPGVLSEGISLSGLKANVVAVPAGVAPQVPMAVLPSVNVPSSSVPPTKWKYFSDPCRSYPAYQLECSAAYQSAYRSGYSEGFKSSYGQQFHSSFKQSASQAFSETSPVEYPEQMAAGKAVGSKDRGISDGFQAVYPELEEQFKGEGQAAFQTDLGSKHLLVVRKLEMVDYGRNGFLEQGEWAQLRLNVDNYGLVATESKKYRFIITNVKGFDSFNAKERPIPSLAPKTSTALLGILVARVADLSQRYLLVEGQFEVKNASGKYELVQKVKYENRW